MRRTVVRAVDGVRDGAHLAGWWWRHRRRQRIWGRAFTRALASGSFDMPGPAVAQLIPTEACNLRCPMCNQWGENGYFLAGARPVDHMDPEQLAALVRELDPRRTLLSVHGGEPLVYRHTERMLDVLAERPLDVLISTNGTRLERHAERLARIENLAFLLSVDGGQASHDAVRGAGSYQAAVDGLAAVRAARRALGRPAPVVIVSTVICEWTADAIPEAVQSARALGALVLNLNLRWFLPEEAGEAYERHLQDALGVTSSGAWRGWVTERRTDLRAAAAALDAALRHRGPPFVVTTPGGLHGRDLERYFGDYGEVFGRDSCFMPFYWARVHANGDLIYCPGHPDVIAGNVFRDGLRAAFNSELTRRFRKHVLTNRLPICNRCCGLYMTDPARGHEQRARRRFGLGPVDTHL